MLMDLSAFKGVYYDLNEIGLALAAGDPGQEALARAKKAVGRLRGFLATVADPPAKAEGELRRVERCLEQWRGQAGNLLAASGPPLALDSARVAHQWLRSYFEGLEKAWSVCALDIERANRAAGWC